jgi:hypothetical protein
MNLWNDWKNKVVQIFHMKDLRIDARYLTEKAGAKKSK